MRWTRSLVLPAIIAVSSLAHAGFFVAMHGEPRSAMSAPSLVELTVAPAPPPPPPPPPLPARPETAPPPSHAPVVRAPAQRVVSRRAPARETPPPPRDTAPPPPADFTGTTLTNDAGDGWASATGDGRSLDGPIGPPAPRERPQATSPAPVTRSTSERPLVALGDLSRLPRAPELNDALARHYPSLARQQGLAGKAVVKARISADGKARVLAIVSESGVGFGAACRRTLDGTRWDPPLDRGGEPVDTVLAYTCRFEVGS